MARTPLTFPRRSHFFIGCSLIEKEQSKQESIYVRVHCKNWGYLAMPSCCLCCNFVQRSQITQGTEINRSKHAGTYLNTIFCALSNWLLLVSKCHFEELPSFKQVNCKLVTFHSNEECTPQISFCKCQC